MYVTHHARSRLKSRVGIKGRYNQDDYAKNAFENGCLLSRKDTTKKILFDGNIFIFKDDNHLVTVINRALASNKLGTEKGKYSRGKINKFINEYDQGLF